MHVPHRTPTKVFFAGTGTEVGKTYVAALVARYLVDQGRRVGVYKPVASGCRDERGESASDSWLGVEDGRISEDAVQLWRAAGQPRALEDVCPQRFLAPLAPPEAAACEGNAVDPAKLLAGVDCWCGDYDIVLVEGAGGLFSPLAEGVLNLDLAISMEAPIVLVAANRLGVIHETLACVTAAANRGVSIAGIILSDVSDQDEPSKASNRSQIERYCDIPIIASVGYQGEPEEVSGILACGF